jgi:hypothetical protein
VSLPLFKVGQIQEEADIIIEKDSDHDIKEDNDLVVEKRAL